MALDVVLLAEIRQMAVLNNVPIIQSGSEQILLETVRANKPLRLLEIGTAIGYSTLLLASAMPDGASLVSVELDKARAVIARQHIAKAGLCDRVTVLDGDAMTVIPELNGDFDFVFLDGPKGQYLAYLTLLINKLAFGAVIFADNVLFRGMVADGLPPRRYRTLVRRLREYVQFVLTDERFATTLLPTGDGVAISVYRKQQGEQ